MIDTSLRPVVHRHVRLQWEPVQSSFVLLYPEGMVKLNTSASEILKVCDGQRTVAQIVELLQQRYPQAGELQDDVADFFAGAIEKGWTELV